MPTQRTAPPLEGEALFRAVADAAPIMLWMADAQGRCRFFNKAWLAFTGRTLDEERDCGWLAGVHPEDRQAFVTAARRSRGRRLAFARELRIRRADRQYRWVLVQASPHRGPGETRHSYIGSCVDISELRDADTAVAGAQRRLSQLIDDAQDMVYRTRLVPRPAIEFVSGAAAAITGHTPEEFYADPDLPRKSVHPDDAHKVVETLMNPARLERAITLRWVHPDGTIVWAEHRRVPVLDASGNVIAIEGIARDLTERIETQQRLRESEEQMRQLAARVQAAREEERAALARELHDELGQTLTAIKLELGRAAAELRRQELARPAVDRLQSLAGLTDIGITMVKRITTDLRPATLDHLGLGAAIRWEAMAFRARTGIRCTVRGEDEAAALDKAQQVALFRIFQEALTNVVRHAKASAVHVVLLQRAGNFELRIRDNGIGIADRQRDDPAAIGLLGMRERAALVGASFAVSGQRGKGTVVSVTIPLAATAATRAGRPRCPSHRRGAK